ncbi:MAG TPA: amidohydrolase [Chloroflexota bacterium]|nr:amidohydrolase [Chloroflexota bacterium]
MQADILLRNAAISTLDPAQPRARCLAVADGRVVAVGSQSLDDLRGPRTRVFDLGGRAVVPGFVDAHVHFGSFALGRQQVDLDVATTLEDGLALLRAAAASLPARAWLRGRGWDRNRWGRLPDAADLDRAVAERPAALASRDGHSLWLNTAALQAAGIDRDTPPPAGGVIVKDVHGEPTGVLAENATDLVTAHMPRASEDDIRDAILAALPLAAAAGLTGIHNLEDSRSRAAFQALEDSGELTLRVYHGVPRSELAHARERGLRTGAGVPGPRSARGDAPPRTAAREPGLRTGDGERGAGGSLLRIGPVKLFADGALGSRTAFMLEPYEGRDDNFLGVPTLEAGELAEAMRLAADAELDLAVHAIGDAAVRRVLDVYAQTRSAYPPLAARLLRIEHAQLVHPADISRFASLGVVASMQPIHATSDWRAADAHWGSRARHGYAWADLLRAGAQLAFGTDAPVERLEPLPSIYAAVTRLDQHAEPAGGWYPHQRLTLDEAVRAYTTGSAAAERATARRGSLAPGMDADLVVLSPDPFSQEPAALRDTRVELTVVGGRITFDGGSW